MKRAVVLRGLQLKKQACIGKVSEEFLSEWKNCLKRTELELLTLLKAEVCRKEVTLLKWQQRMASLELEEDQHVVEVVKEWLERSAEELRAKLMEQRQRKMCGFLGGILEQVNSSESLMLL